MTQQATKARIAARRAAETVLELAQGEANRCGDESHFWRELIRLVKETVPIFPASGPAAGASSEPPAMTDEQARRWERTPIPFGKYKGQPVADVSLLYLDRLTDEGSFIKSLKRYLASETIAAALRQEIAGTGQRY